MKSAMSAALSPERMKQIKVPAFLAWPFRRWIRKHYYASLGASISMWAATEYWMDCCVGLIYAHYEGSRFGRKAPRTLSGKITYLSEAFKDPKVPKDVSARGMSLLAEIGDLADKRHLLIHSVGHKFSPHLFSRTVHKFEYRIGGLQREVHEIHFMDLQQFMDEAYSYGLKWAKLFEDFLTVTIEGAVVNAIHQAVAAESDEQA